VGVAEGVGKIPGGVKDIYGAESTAKETKQEVPGLMERINQVEDTSFFKYNAFLDEPGQPGYNKEAGAFDVWSDKGTGEPSVTESLFFDVQPNDNLKGLNNVKPKVAADVRTRADDTQAKVDSLFGAKDDMGKADISAFDKGSKAFEKGDREGVIDAITELEKESARLKDNWRMTEQVRAGVIDPVNVESAFNKEGSFFGGSGDRKSVG
jgi:hypothetical protein